jgi:hypothetical protein
MEWFISMIISVVTDLPGPTREGKEEGHAMPILIWIVTVACMLEIAIGHGPDQGRKDLPPGSTENLDRQAPGG